MQNSYEKPNIENSTNPFAKPIKKEEVMNANINTGKRLNIIDMDVLNSSNKNSELEILEKKMNNLSKMINQNTGAIDPIALEEMKIEWEELRDRVNKEKSKNHKKNNNQNVIKTLNTNFSKLITMIKIYSPKIKNIMNTLNEINKEVEDLVKKATPTGEEEIKYGMLVNKIYQASKLNETLTSEIK